MKRPRPSKTRRVTHALLETTPVRRKRLSPVEVLHEALAETHALAKRARKAGDVDNHRIYSDRAVSIATALLQHEAPSVPGNVTDVFLSVFERQRVPAVLEAPRDNLETADQAACVFEEPKIVDGVATEVPEPEHCQNSATGSVERAAPQPQAASADQASAKPDLPEPSPEPPPQPQQPRHGINVLHVDYARQRPSVLEHPTVAAERFDFGPRGGARG
jgi:hypothetical protein